MSTSRDQGIRRREFLAVSACALATAVVAPKLLGGETQPRSIATAFAAFDFGPARAESELWVVPAERIGAADRAFLTRGASVTISGANGGDPRARRIVGFETHYTYSDGGERREAPFYAWAGGGGSVQFTVPVDDEQRIRFSLTTAVKSSTGSRSRRRVVGGAKAAPTALPLELSMAGPIPLQRGFYVIVPLLDGEPAPGWWEYSLRNTNGRWALHSVAGTPVPFEHFVVHVDYAAPAATKDSRP